MKRPFAFLSVGLLVSALPSFASSGGDSSASGFCLEPGGQRVLFLASEGGGSELRALDVRTGRTSVALTCDSDQQKRCEKVLQSCTPLVATSPSAVGLVATVFGRGQASFPTPPDDPMWFQQRGTSPQRLELRRAGALVGSLDFPSCLFSSHPKVAWLTLLVAPKKPFGVLVVTHPGTCTESGYLKDEVVLWPRVFGARGPPASGPSHPVPVALRHPDVDLSGEFLEAAEELERANKPAAAERYRTEAEDSRRFSVAEALEAGCLDADSGRLFARGAAFDLEPGAATPLAACRTSACTTRPANCAPLRSEWLSALGISASVRRAGKPQVPEPSERAVDFRVRCPQELVLSRNGALVAVHAFSTECPTNSPAQLVAWPVPQKKLVVFRLAPTGSPRDSSELFAIAAPRVEQSRRAVLTEAEHWLPLDLPHLERSQLLNDAGMVLSRKGRFDEAAGYFAEAWAASRNTQPRLFIALFNQAAALARSGDADQSLGLLRRLLSFSTERERFVASLATDDAFASLRTDARLVALLTEPDCCVETQQTPEWTSVVRWRDGEAQLLHRVVFRKGAKVEEFDADAGVSRSWNEAGQLRSEDLLADGEKHGPSRRWDDAGQLLTEAMYVDGLKSGLERQWSPAGRLLSETTWEAGARTGRQRTWFPTGAPRSDAWLVEGGGLGLQRTWYESGQLETETALVDAGVAPRPGSETLQFRRWSETGQLLAESWTVGGRPHGTWREWSASGQLTRETSFVLGVPVDGGVSPR